MIGLLCSSHLSEMPLSRAHRHHHTALRLCGVNCTACVTPLRGYAPHNQGGTQDTVGYSDHDKKQWELLCRNFSIFAGKLIDEL